MKEYLKGFYHEFGWKGVGFAAILLTAGITFGVGMGLEDAHAQAVAGPKREIWTCSLDNIGATLTRCIDNPSNQRAMFITDVITQSTTTTGGTFILRYGDNGTANCGANTVSVLPSGATAARLSSPANTAAAGLIQLLTPLRVPPGKDLCLLGVGTNTTTAQINGYYE